MNDYHLYVLIKDKKPVYIGISKSIHNRMQAHKQEKNFDTYIIIQSYKDKKYALVAERALYNFLFVFGSDFCLNSVHVQFIHECFRKGILNNKTKESNLDNEHLQS